MAAARYSQDVLQSQTDADLEEILNLDEYIQRLPPELREKIYKEFVVIKMRERMEMGWYEVKEQIDCAPLCEKKLRITKVLFINKNEWCSQNRGLCYLCKKKKWRN